MRSGGFMPLWSLLVSSKNSLPVWWNSALIIATICCNSNKAGVFRMCLFGYVKSLCIVATTKLRVICFYCHIATHLHCVGMLTTPVTKLWCFKRLRCKDGNIFFTFWLLFLSIAPHRFHTLYEETFLPFSSGPALEMAGLNLFTSRSLPHSTVTQSLSPAPSLFLVKVNWPRSRHKTLICSDSSLISDTLIFFFHDPENKTPESLKKQQNLRWVCRFVRGRGVHFFSKSHLQVSTRRVNMQVSLLKDVL